MIVREWGVTQIGCIRRPYLWFANVLLFFAVASHGQDSLEVTPPVNTTPAIQEYVFPSSIYGSPDGEVLSPEADSIALIKALTDTATVSGPTPSTDSASKAFFQKDKAKTPKPQATTITGSDAVLAREPEDEKVLELEMDVVVGYGTMKKDDLTGSVVSIKSDELVREAVFSVRKSLQGKAAGVNITQNSGAPGKALTVRIRGVGTINNSDPLYVVDGVPIKDIDFLNPNDIEAISILKDASATAIYGSRGANGVVLVTTKMPREGTSRIIYDFSIGTQQPGKKPSLLTAEEWAILNNEAQAAANKPTAPELANPFLLGEGTDWFDEVTRSNALIQSHNVSVSRGTDKLKYFLSAGHFAQEGIIKGSGFEKMTFRFNAKNKVSDWFMLGNNTSVAHSTTDHANETDEWNSVMVNAIAMDPATPRDSAGVFLPSNYNNLKHPVGIVENYNNNMTKTSINGTIYSNIKFLDAFDFKTMAGIDMSLSDSSEFGPKYEIGSNDKRANAVVTNQNTLDYSLIFENTLTYKKSFLDKHSLSLMAGQTAERRDWEFILAENNTTPSNAGPLQVLRATKSQQPRVDGTMGGNTLASFFGRGEYNFDSRYLLTCTIRRDGSSRFGPGYKWGSFPSLAGAWKISEEPFMQNVTFIEGLKLRVGWGKTGNQEIPDYLYTTVTTGGQDYPLGDNTQPGTTFLSAGNPEIHWEAQAATNVGFDFSLFGGRIEFLADLFTKKTEDMLLRAPIPLMSGLQTPPMANIGSLENRGLEMVLNYREKIGRFTSNLGLNFATYHNKILNLGKNAAGIYDAKFKTSYVTLTKSGHAIGKYFGYKTDGLFQTWDEVNAHTYFDTKDSVIKLVQSDAAPGDVRYRDDDGDGNWDRGFIGSPHPDFTMGINLELAYGDFDFNMGLQGVYGNELFNGARFYSNNTSASNNLDKNMIGRWTGPGTTNDVNLPRMNARDANNMEVSDRFIEDGSYLRFKSMQFGYTLKKSLARRLRVKKCRVYVGLENLFTLTRYMGLEPEVGQGEIRGDTKNPALTVGVDRTTYPQARSFLFGLNLTL